MRKIAQIKNNPPIKRAMIYSCEDGVYLFLYKENKDSLSCADYWFENLEDAEKVCAKDYGLTKKDWQPIDDPLPNCQHDLIAPVRIKDRDLGKPKWGSYEKLENGEWKPFKFES